MGLKCSSERKTTYGLLKPYEKCKTCQYRAQKSMPNNCDYILITGHMRGWNHRVPYLQLGVKNGRK